MRHQWPGLKGGSTARLPAGAPAALPHQPVRLGAKRFTCQDARQSSGLRAKKRQLYIGVEPINKVVMIHVHSRVTQPYMCPFSPNSTPIQAATQH